jgi:biotin carboxyl carrier protein
MAENQVEKLMRVLNLTEQEALEVIECDKRIDRGEKLFELTEDQKVAEKQARLTGERKPTKTTKREKKVDNQKQDIIATMVGSIINVFGVRVDVANEEREFEFELNGRKFKVVLSCPRK